MTLTLKLEEMEGQADMPARETRIPMQRWGDGWICLSHYPVAETGPHHIMMLKTAAGFDCCVLPLNWLPTKLVADKMSGRDNG